MTKSALSIFTIIIFTMFSASTVYSMEKDEDFSNKKFSIINMEARIEEEPIDFSSLSKKSFPKDTKNSKEFDPLSKLSAYDLKYHEFLIFFIANNREDFSTLSDCFENLPPKSKIFYEPTKEDFFRIISIILPKHAGFFEKELYAKKPLNYFAKTASQNPVVAPLLQNLTEAFESPEAQSIFVKTMKFCNSAKNRINNLRLELEKTKHFCVKKIHTGIHVLLEDPFKPICSLIIAAGIIFPDFQNTPFFTIALSTPFVDVISFLWNFLTYEETSID